MISLVLLLALGGLMSATRSFAPGDGVLDPATSTALGFGFLLLAALFGGRSLSKLSMPLVTGYLIAGVVTGPYALDLVSLDMVHTLRIVNGVAVCLIALTAGGELSVRKIRPLLTTIRSMTLWAVLGTSLLLTLVVFAMRPLLPFLGGLGLGQALAIAAVLGVTLASQSPAVVMSLINETRSDGPVTQTTLALVVIADLVIIVLYALTSSIATAVLGGSTDVTTTLATVAWELFGSIAIGLAIGFVLATFLRFVAGGVGLFVLLVCFVVAEVGVRVHLDPLIVTLTAGFYLQNLSRVDASRLIHDIESASLPVYLVFFALAGASLDLQLLWSVLLPAAIICVVRAAGFSYGCRRAARRTHAGAMVEKWVWVGLLPQAGLALALALLITRSFPELGVGAAALVLGVVGLNQVVTPVFMRIALIRSGEAHRRGEFEFAAGDDRPPPTETDAADTTPMPAPPAPAE